MLRAVANWWDALELWVTQLAFPLQVLLAIVVVLPLCWGAAALLDRTVDAAVLVTLQRRRDRDSRVSARPPSRRHVS